MKINVLEAGGMLSTLSAGGMGKRLSNLLGADTLGGVS